MPSPNLTLAKVLRSTFDPQGITTRTPSLPQACPQVNAEVKPEFPGEYDVAPRDFSIHQAVLDYLNAGGNPQLLQDHLFLPLNGWALEDVTGDGIPEVMIVTWGLDIYTCNNGQYVNIFLLQAGDLPGLPHILSIQDMNLDRVPELVLEGVWFSVGDTSYFIYEWNGEVFQSLIWSDEELKDWYSTPQGRAMNWYHYWNPDGYISSEPAVAGPGGSAIIRNTDGNGTQELVINFDMPDPRHRGEGPWRKTTETYQWNGLFFILDHIEIEPPVYRFQAVQDADRMVMLGEYQPALD